MLWYSQFSECNQHTYMIFSLFLCVSKSTSLETKEIAFVVHSPKVRNKPCRTHSLLGKQWGWQDSSMLTVSGRVQGTEPSRWWAVCGQMLKQACTVYLAGAVGWEQCIRWIQLYLTPSAATTHHCGQIVKSLLAETGSQLVKAPALEMYVLNPSCHFGFVFWQKGVMFVCG